MTTQPTPATVRELRRQGLTTADIAKMFRLHPRPVASILNSEESAQRRDLRNEVSG